MSLRSELQAHLEAALPSNVTVYPVGVDVVAIPAVVINPADPYMTPTSMGVDAANMVAINLELVVQRATVDDAMDSLEDMRKHCTDAIKAFLPRGRWTSFGKFGSITISDVQYATATIDCLFVDGQDRGSD